MPTNDEGKLVNEDGTPITQEQQETYDWDEVIKLHSSSNLKPYSMEELATTSVPHNIPYLEVYMTDELYYKEYKSPYLSQISAGEGGSSGMGGGEDGGSEESLWTELANIVNNHITVSEGKKDQYIQRLRDANTNWTSIARIVNGHKIFGNATQDTVIRAILNAKKKNNESNSNQSSNSVSPKHNSLNKNAKLKEEIKRIVKNNFKSGIKVNSATTMYMNCKTDLKSIGLVTVLYKVYLKQGSSETSVTKAIYNAKHRYR